MQKEEAEVTVMVIDDTPANLEILETMLQREGYDVVEFPNGAWALAAAAQAPPDLILLDILMPAMDGFEVCRRLKADAKLKDIPIIFISALDDSVNKVKAFAEGGVDYVSKPFQEEEVIARIGTQLHLRRKQIQIEAQHKQIEHSYQQLRKLEEQRDQLVHMIVHDLRSPLTVIHGYAQLLEKGLKETGQAELVSGAEHILDSARALVDMISTMLDLSRLEANEMPLAREACDLRDIVSQTLGPLGALGALAAEVIIAYDEPPEAMPAFCDPQITGRILQNLVSNGIKFGGEGGEVGVHVSQDDDMVKITVRDHGPGIPQEYQETIFDKYGQVAARKEGHKYSAGLGLAFCKIAVEAQGGCIGVESQVGEGSAFWFTLPSASRL